MTREIAKKPVIQADFKELGICDGLVRIEEGPELIRTLVRHPVFGRTGYRCCQCGLA